MMRPRLPMKTARSTTAFCLLALLAAQPLSAESQIKLTGRKDLVLSSDSRQTVLDVARQHLSAESEFFLGQIDSAGSPFRFDQPVVALRPDGPGSTEPAEAAPVNYDDASVLQAVAKSFAPQVRGTLARGSTSFLQLRGGSMVKPGTSFPANIPQAEGRQFTVIITEITANGYTLKLGEATQTVSLSGTSTSASGNIQLD